jgi:hypothetical protein
MALPGIIFGGTMNRKKQQKIEKARAAEKRSRQRDPQVRRGFRKMIVDGEVYQWRSYGDKVEIRTPGERDKWMVPIWTLQGIKTVQEWREPHKDCYDECIHTGNLGCGILAVTPGMVREYIDQMRKVTSNGN